MATYKVLQDIEAEDKLLGPLSLKQFGFAAITVVCGYVSFLFITKGVWFLAIPLLPVGLVFGFLAFPWGRDQSTEVWLLAKIRFLFKPRRRIWDQEGMEELVTITVPKKVETYELTKGFSKEEAKSRLKALADTIDSRGWVVKNVNVNLYAHPGSAFAQPNQDRLIDTSSFAQPQAVIDVHASDDVLDENSQAAQQLSQLLNASTTNHREAVLQQMKSPQAPAPQSSSITPADEQALLDKIHKEQSAPKPVSHLRTIKPLSVQKQEAAAKKRKNSKNSTKETTSSNKMDANSVAAPGSTSVNPVILALADNDDLNVSTIAREAKKATESSSDNEVVVSLR